MATPTQNMPILDVIEGTNHFSTSFFAEVASSNHGNLITSPLSVSIVLSMAAYGARGETQDEMRSVLHLPPMSQATRGYSNLIKYLSYATDVESHLANKIFTNKGFSVKPSYEKMIEDAFLSSSQSVDFSQSASAANTINQWVEEQTNHRIKDLVNSDSFSSSTVMFLVNAVYFKGNWKTEFDPRFTQNRPFYVSKTEVKNVPTMFGSGKYNYGVLPECKASFVELPYKGEDCSMLIILPDEIDGLAAVEKKMALHGPHEVLKKGETTEVQVYLPKFTIESSFNLNQHLKNMGIRKAFEKTEANFQGISDSDVYISKVVQKAFIEVNEEGTEAAGSSGVETDDRIDSSVHFVVHHPFFYAIVNKVGNGSESPVRLFEGHIVDPVN
ncbi:PREDICTED: antichymotrypsin-2-like [Polistes canadensis]|uniref:antichymotrypsin-2-like n=1 Tax=Polistes canadensis TaxID=91411 RepID=UPI000718D5A4|nr:PREDICTED: antichymotrypsin-2-like [Polistes canadensis]